MLNEHQPCYGFISVWHCFHELHFTRTHQPVVGVIALWQSVNFVAASGVALFNAEVVMVGWGSHSDGLSYETVIMQLKHTLVGHALPFLFWHVYLIVWLVYLVFTPWVFVSIYLLEWPFTLHGCIRSNYRSVVYNVYTVNLRCKYIKCQTHTMFRQS